MKGGALIYAHLAKGLFSTKDTWKIACARRTLWPPPFYLKAEDKTLILKMLSLFQEGKETFSFLEFGGRSQEEQTGLVKIIFAPPL